MAVTARRFCSLALVAMALAGMFSSGHAHSHGEGRSQVFHLFHAFDICKNADYPVVCRSAVNGLGNPYNALERAIRQLMSETKRAMGAIGGRKSEVMDVCRETYDDAISNLETCLSNLKSHDKPSLNINLSAALTDYSTCDDAVSDGGMTSPITLTNALLSHMASNCLYLSSLKW